VKISDTSPAQWLDNQFKGDPNDLALGAVEALDHLSLNAAEKHGR
jgi:hypothetical protein